MTGNELHEAYHFVQETDPGAVGSGKYWLKVSTAELNRRNDANSAWVVVLGGKFTALTDTPSSYTGNANKAITVKPDESGLEFKQVATRAPLVYTLTGAPTVNTNALDGDLFLLEVDQNLTLANPTNGEDGLTLKWRIKQDVSGGWVVTLGSDFRIPDSTTPPLAWSIAADAMDFLAATYNDADGKWDIIAFIPGYLP